LNVTLSPPGVPFITRFAPAIAMAGATVTISGTNFSSVAESNIVHFGAVRASVVAANNTNLMVVVPVSATYGPIAVTVDGLTAYAPRSFIPTFHRQWQCISAASFGPRQNLATASGPGQTVIADLDGDGKPDLVCRTAVAMWFPCSATSPALDR